MSRKLVVGSMALALALMAGSAMAAQVWTFDCDAWPSGNNVTTSWADNGGGKMVYEVTGGDPHVFAPDLDTSQTVAGTPVIRVSVTAMDPEPTGENLYIYIFSDAGHGGFPATETISGPGIYTWDLANTDPPDNGGYKDGTDVTNFRLDFSQEGTAATYQIDWVYMGDDANFTPAEQDTTACPDPEPRNPVDAEEVSVAPVQDGVINADEYGFGAPVNISSVNAFQVAWGANAAVDASDCSFDIYTAWDADALYVALDVTDDTVLSVGDGAIADQNGEFLQIVLAAEGGVAREAGSLADFSLADGGGINWRNNAGGGDVDWGSANITGGWAATANGYAFEVRFPWADFNWALPAIQAGSAIKALFAVVDVDTPAEWNVFMLSSGGPEANPFENHKDLSAVNLVEALQAQPIVMTFDCGFDGWGPANNVALTHMIDGNNGLMGITPTGADPFAQVAVNVAGEALPEFAALVYVENLPDGVSSIPTAMYFWTPDGPGRVATGSLVDGLNVIQVNVPANQDLNAGTVHWDNTVHHVRFDIAEGATEAPYIAAGTTVWIDAIAISDDPAFEPEVWTVDIDCDNDGLSNAQEEAMGTDPANSDTDGDGVSDGIEVRFGSDPLDPEDTVQVPVAGALALMALALALAAAAIIRRRRTA